MGPRQGGDAIGAAPHSSRHTPPGQPKTCTVGAAELAAAAGAGLRAFWVLVGGGDLGGRGGARGGGPPLPRPPALPSPARRAASRSPPAAVGSDPACPPRPSCSP